MNVFAMNGRSINHKIGAFTLPLVLFFGCFASSAIAGINQWTRIGPGGGKVCALAIDPVDSGTVYAGTSSGVFKSTDGGASWQAANMRLPLFCTSLLAIDPLKPATVYAVIDIRGVFKSTNGGASWQELRNRFIYALAIDPLNPATVYAGGESEEEIVRLHQDARERGVVVVAARSEEKIVRDLLRPATVYAGDYRYKVSKSTDGGANWHAANTGLPDLRIYALAIDRLNPATVYAGTDGGGVFKSTDGGADWYVANTGLPDLNIRDLAIDPLNPATVYAGSRHVYAGYADGGISKSTDGGASWQAANTGLTDLSIHALAIDPLNPDTVYVGTGGGVFKSTNGGANWQAVNTGLTDLEIRALAIDPLNPATVYAGTQGGGAFKITFAGRN